MANLLNISSLSNPTLISGAKNQLVSSATNKVKTTVLSKADELKNKLIELTKKRVAIEKEYVIKNIKLQEDYKNGVITQEEEQQKYQQFQQQKADELKLLDEEIQKLKDEITNLINDPLKKAKAEKKQIQAIIDKNIKISKKGVRKANIARIKQVLGNAKKTIAPILLTQITNTLVKVATQTSRLQELVNDTNEIIDTADTPEKIQQAIIARNNAIQIINNQEKKLEIVRILIKVLQVVIIVSEIIIIVLTILFTIPPPAGLGPIMPPPIKRIIEKLKKIIEILSLAIPIIVVILDQAMAELEDFKAQLHDINDLLDIKSPNLSNNQLGPLLNPAGTGLQLGIFPEIYNGFKFAIKEETGPKAIIVRGNKRHYAVAIDTNNVEVLKSEVSFTLDPNDLIDQLKLVIDSQNLIA
jgi:DNA repair exonuclease SbcCD ATPase subunit